MAPYVMDSEKDEMRISETQSLSIGSYGNGEGSERKHKDIKNQMYTWTHRPGFSGVHNVANDCCQNYFCTVCPGHKTMETKSHQQLYKDIWERHK